MVRFDAFRARQRNRGGDVDQQSAEKIESLAQQLHAAQARIIKLENSNGALARANTSLMERLAMADHGDGKAKKRGK